MKDRQSIASGWGGGRSGIAGGRGIREVTGPGRACRGDGEAVCSGGGEGRVKV